MAKKAKRQKAIKRLNLSDHTLDINIRWCSYNKFNFSDIEEYAKAHFERVNRKLSTLNLADIDSQYRAEARQYYTFALLVPNQFPGWIADLKKGKLG